MPWWATRGGTSVSQEADRTGGKHSQSLDCGFHRGRIGQVSVGEQTYETGKFESLSGSGP